MGQGSVRLALMTLLSGALTGALVLPAGAFDGAVLETLDTQPSAIDTEQIAQMPLVQITNVRLEETDAGLQVVLETAEGELLTPTTSVSGNALIIEITNAVLTGEAFEQFEPADGITLVQVSALSGDRVQVVLTGTDAVPMADVNTDVAELTLSIMPGIAQAGETSEPLRIVVTGEGDEGYNPSSTSTATRTDTPLRDIPQSIQVVPQRVLRDQQVNTLDEALRNVSGVSQASPSRLLGESFTIRGFSTSSSTFLRNGLQDSTSNISGFDPIFIDRIEVLKGPASVLYGQGQLGGAINYVKKQPLRAPFYFVEGAVGNFDFYRGALDLSGPLNSNRTVLYRLNAAAQSGGIFIEPFESQRYAIAPTFKVLFGDQTSLTVESEYLETRRSYDSGLPAAGTVLSNPFGEIPQDRFTGEPSDPLENYQTYRIGYNFEHRFSENWQIRSAFRTSLQRLVRDYTIAVGLLDDNRTLNRFYATQNGRDNLFNLDNYVTGQFATGNIQHELVLGLNLSRLDAITLNTVGQAAPLDVFDPVYGQPRGAVLFQNDLELQSDTLGIYLQDQITLAENLKLLLGGRFDIVSQTRENLVAETSDFQQYEAFSPRVGIVYQPFQPISLYTSYSRSFSPAQSVFENLFPEPERGTQYEVGAKVDLSNRLSATLAFYDLTRSNVLTTDPNNPLNSIPVGEQNSRGIEFDISGEILPGWDIIAGYAYTDSRITKDNSSNQGNRINNVPYNSFNLWTTYELQSGDLQGLGFGLGLFYEGDRQGDLGNSFELPSYLRTDAAIFYEREQFRAALNFRNLFDIEYFGSSFSQGRVFYGSPFTVQGAISWKF